MPTSDPRRFRHRTAEVEAVQWTGSNAEQMRTFCGPDFDEIDPEDRGENPDATAAVRESAHGEWRGLEPGWWAVKIGDQLYEESDADFKASFEPAASSPQPDHVTAIYDAIDAFQRQFRTVGLQHAQIRASLAEYLARELSPPATDRATLLEQIAGAVRGVLPMSSSLTHSVVADAVLAVLPPTTDRSAVLREEAVLIRTHCPDHLDSESAEGSWISCHCDVADDMERRADEAQPETEAETPKRPPMDPVRILGVGAERSDPTQCSGEEGFCPEHGFHRHSLKQPAGGAGGVADETGEGVVPHTMLGAAEIETRPDLNVTPLTGDTLNADEEINRG